MAHHRGGFATELLVGLVTRVQECCAAWEVEYTKVHSQTLKKFITGTGRAEKAAVIEAVNKKFGITVVDDNEADALALLSWVENEFGIQWINKNS
jgi:Holliday junction resolvasome RuvABC endonuclease subunit